MKRVAALVITVIAFAIMGGALVHGDVFSIRDHVGYFQPMRWFTALELHKGRLPLWNPYSDAGEPWLANPQTGIFYPPAWLFVVLPFSTAYVLYPLLHAILMGGGAFALFARRVSPQAALLGAVALMVSGPVLSLVDVVDNYTSLAWLPLVLWCAVSNAGPRLSALVIAMSFLAGEPLFAAIGALAFALLRWRAPRAVLVCGVAAFGLVAVQVLPFLEMLRGSDRSEGIAADLLLRDSLAPLDWLRIVVPPHLHSNIADAHLHQQFVPIVYCGVIVVLLATLAVAASLRRRDAQLALGVVALAFVLGAGEYLAPVGWMWVHLPVKVLRYPARFLSLAAIAIAFLAAVGWEWLSQRLTWRWLGFAVMAAVAIDGVARTAPLFTHHPFQPNPVPHPLAVGRDGFIVRFGKTSGAERRTWIDGYLNLLDQRFDATSPAPVTNAKYNRIIDGVAVQRLSMMSARYILSDTSLPAPLIPIDTYHGVTAYRNPGAFPLAYFHGDDGRYAAVSFMSIGTSFVRLEVKAPSSGVVVVAQQSAPGWEASVDGRPSGATTLVNGIFRAVRVGAGRHAVEWKYHPLSLRVGAVMSILALVWMFFGVRAMRPMRAFVKR